MTRNPSLLLSEIFDQLGDPTHNESFDFRYGSYLPSPRPHIEYALEDVEKLGIDPSSSKIIDLGFGLGHVVTAFAREGYRTYGIERNPQLFNDFQENVHNDLSDSIQVIQGNYLDSDFSQKHFPDGTSPSEIDVFYCFFYHMDHRREVLNSSDYAKPGAIVLLDPYDRREDEELLREINTSFILKSIGNTKFLQKK